MVNDVETIQRTVNDLSKTETPFMILFFLVMVFVIYMAIKVMKYVSSVSDGNIEQIANMNKNMAKQREDHYKMIMEDRIHFEQREKQMFLNLEKNTKQLTGIAMTLKEVQSNFSSLENKVMKNFDYLEYEIENLKERIIKKSQGK